MVEQLSSDELPTEWLLAFEFSHIMLFFMALAYVGQCIHSSIVVIKSRESWAEMDVFGAKQLKRGLSNATQWDFGVLGKFGSIADQYNYFLLKSLFISKHKLPRDFEVRA